MKSSLQTNALLCIGAACMLCSVFQKPIGLPEWSQFIFGGAAVVCSWSAVWLQRRAKRRGEQVPVLAPTQERSRTRLMIVLVIIASLSGPFWLPYTGINLSFPQSIIAAIISCICSVAAVLLGVRLRSKV